MEDHSQYELIEISALRGAEKTPNYTEIQKWVSEATFRRWFRQHLNKGDILISTVGSVGLSAFIDIPRGAIAQNLIGLRISPDNCSGFVFYWSRTHEFQKEIRKVVMDAVQPSLKRPHLLSFMIKRPPLPEQQLISYKLNSATTATINAQLCFHKLRSLKTAIMQDLLTGKKRVTALLKETTKL